MEKKIIRRPIENLQFAEHDLHPLLQRIYATRGIQHAVELDRSFEQLLSYQNMLSIDQAVDLLAEVIMQQQRILIVVDFDADGATSSAVAIRALKSFGAQFVDYLVPTRFAFCYCLTP